MYSKYKGLVSVQRFHFTKYTLPCSCCRIHRHTIYYLNIYKWNACLNIYIQA